MEPGQELPVPKSGDGLDLRSERLGALPLIQHFLERLDIAALLARHVPTTDRRTRVPHDKALGVLLRSVLLEREPVYREHETVATYAPEAFGLTAEQAAALTDDHIGHGLDRLYDADRGTLSTEVVLGAARAFEIALDEFHNDSTSIRLTGQYHRATGRSVRGRRAPVITYGHSKDHRPDLKQLLYILTTTRDGTVPCLFRCEAGIRKGDVLLLDRGYPSFDDLAWLVSEELDFVVRVKLDLAKCIRAFAESGAAEGVVVLRPTATSVLQEGEVTLRIVRAGAPDGEPVFLLTTLGGEVADREEVAWLYSKRWWIEEHYKLTQSPHCGQGFLHAKSVRGVAQEIYAQALLIAVTRHLAASAAATTAAKYEEISTKGALLAVSSRITVLALGTMTPHELTFLLERIASSLEPKRPGRSFPRRSFTPQSKWGPYGKRRDCRRKSKTRSAAKRVP